MSLLRNGPTSKDGFSDDKESMEAIQPSAHTQKRRSARVFMQAVKKGCQSEISGPIKYFSAPTVIMELDDNTRVIRMSIA